MIEWSSRLAFIGRSGDTKLLHTASAACVFAAALYEAAAIEFISNPLLGHHGLFMANTAHNMVDLLISALFGRFGWRPF